MLKKNKMNVTYVNNNLLEVRGNYKKRNYVTAMLNAFKYVGLNSFKVFNFCLENKTILLFMVGGFEKIGALQKIKKIFQGGNIGLAGYEASTIVKENPEGILSALNVKGILPNIFQNPIGENVNNLSEGVVSVLNNSETIMQVADVGEPLLTPAVVIGSSIIAAKKTGIGVYSLISQIVGNSISTIGVGTSSVFFGGIVMPYMIGPMLFPNLLNKLDKLDKDLYTAYVSTKLIFANGKVFVKMPDGSYQTLYNSWIDPLKEFGWNYYNNLSMFEHIFVITSISLTIYGVYRMAKSSYNYVKEKIGYV